MANRNYAEYRKEYKNVNSVFSYQSPLLRSFILHTAYCICVTELYCILLLDTWEKRKVQSLYEIFQLSIFPEQLLSLVKEKESLCYIFISTNATSTDFNAK